MCVCVHVCVCMCVCACACVYVCMRACAFTLYVWLDSPSSLRPPPPPPLSLSFSQPLYSIGVQKELDIYVDKNGTVLDILRDAYREVWPHTSPPTEASNIGVWSSSGVL